MQSSPKILSTEYTDLNKVIRWFIDLRWVACGVVLLTLLIFRFWLRFELPYTVLFALTGVLFIVNLGFTVYYHGIKSQYLSRSEMSLLFHIQVCSDYALLFLLVYFTGFLENPISFFFVFHIMLTSFIFPQAAVFIYTGSLFTLFLFTILAEFFQIIPHFPLHPASFDGKAYFDSLFVKSVGVCSTLIVSAYLITSIKKRIEERGKSIEVELNRYRNLDKAKSNFILQVTHELRGPIAALSGFHDMILKGITGRIEARTQDIVQKADRRTGNLLIIIDEMIDYAYMRTEEEIEYEKSPIRLKEIIAHNLELFTSQREQSRLKFASNCPANLSIWANRDLLNIIFSNLITNAVKYSKPDTTVRINALAEKETVHILVEDEGIGIEPDELDKIFEEFYRTRRAREVDRDGTGLGLPIVKRAVEALGGKVFVYSEVGKGTKFHIYMPIYSRNGETKTVNRGS